MRRALVFLSLAAVVAPACSSPRGTYVTPAELEQMEEAEAEAEAADGASAMSSTAAVVTSAEVQKKQRELDGRQRALQRRREDHERAVLDLEDERKRTEIQHASAVAEEQVELLEAQRKVRIAGEDLDHFTEVLRDRRLREDALAVEQSMDRLIETREELAQLEMMYDGSDLGDATAEIVLNRTRRRLARAETRHELRLEESRDLTEIELPRKEEELRTRVEAELVALENAERKRDAAALKRAMELRDLEGKLIGLDRERVDIEREESELAQDRQRWERSL